MSRGDFKRELKACDMLERAVLEALKDKISSKGMSFRKNGEATPLPKSGFLRNTTSRPWPIW